MKKRMVWLSAAVILATAGLGAVSASGQEANPIKVGVVLSLTGAQTA